MTEAGAEGDSIWIDGFLFLGNQLALDLLNTRPVQSGEPMELLADFTAVLRWFQAADLLSSREARRLQQQWGQSVEARRVLAEARALRGALRKEILAWEDGDAIHHSTVTELNRLMAKHPMHIRLRGNGKGPSMELYFSPQQPEDLLAPLAHSAAMLFTSVDRARVRKCDQCVLHFFDISKKGTRRWCSMQLCEDRLKVAAYARRKRLDR